MEKKVIETLANCVATGASVALVSVVSNSGVSPAKCGAIMLVNSSGSMCGTVGGGKIELKVIGQAQECIRFGRSGEVAHSLGKGSGPEISDSGKVHFLIKVFSAQPRLVIVGGGHVGIELYHQGLLQGYRVEIIDDRDNIATKERFPDAAQIICGDPVKELADYPFDSNCFITITTHSHELDWMSLAVVAESGAGYIGMIGSSNKIKKSISYLLDQGVPRQAIDKLYTPMGLNVATIQPKEIAVSIISEILLVKNNGTPDHMKTVKNIQF